MEEYLNGLQEKNGYSDDLKQALGKIIPAFVEHFGKENEQLILDAISSCEIHVQEKKEDATQYVSEFFPDKKIDHITALAGAFYDSMPLVNGDEFSSKRLIYIVTRDGNINLQDEKKMSTLVHEMGHLIKAYNNEYFVENGQIKKRDGISTTIINQDKETGKYIDGEDIHTGLEEAVNCYDEEKIMSIILGREFTDVAYHYFFNEAINPLFENQELMMAFRNAQLHGTDEHINLIGVEDFERLSAYFEDIYVPLIYPFKAIRTMGGVKGVIERREKAQTAIIDYGNKYMEKKENNFSLDRIEELDKTISFDERETGIKDLRENININETQEKTNMVEEIEDDSRI